MIVRWPGRIASGAVCPVLASAALDLMPTLCDLAAVDEPDGCVGRSLGPVLRGEAATLDRDAIFVETAFPPPTNDGTLGRMVRTDRFKYIAYNRGRYREQLIDMEADPGEMVNLAVESRYASELERHRDLLRDWVEATDDAKLRNVRWQLFPQT
jgi:arylsulfatase A-like enzyme